MFLLLWASLAVSGERDSSTYQVGAISQAETFTLLLLTGVIVAEAVLLRRRVFWQAAVTSELASQPQLA